MRDVPFNQPAVDQARDEALDGVRVRGSAAPLERGGDFGQGQLVGRRSSRRGRRVQRRDFSHEPSGDGGPQLLEEEVGPGLDVFPILLFL